MGKEKREVSAWWHEQGAAALPSSNRKEVMEILKSGKPDEEGRAHQPCRARADFRRVQSLECSLEPEWRGT